MRLTVKDYKRLQNSKNGNARYRFVFEEGITALSATDTSFVYTLPASKYVGQEVEVTMSGGKITGMAPATNE